MDQDKKQAIALMRCSAIAPLISDTLTDHVSLNAFFREVSARGLKSPNGELRYYAPATICRFINQMMLQERLTGNQDIKL